MTKFTLIFAALVVGVLVFRYKVHESHADDVASKIAQAKQAEQLDANDQEEDGDVRNDPDAEIELPETEAEWRERLTRLQYSVTRQHGTERAFANTFWDNKRDGLYRCVCCELPLFDSSAKFKSGTGWPSYFQPVAQANVETETDRKMGSVRTEVHCKRCKAHLGHVFGDGPRPTGLRYCINSASLTFEQVQAVQDELPGEELPVKE